MDDPTNTNEKGPTKTNQYDNATPAEKRSTSLGELRSSSQAVAFRPQERRLHDPDVTFEEYMYYAAKSRAEEDASASAEAAEAETAAPARARTTFMDVFLPSVRGGVRELKGVPAAADGTTGTGTRAGVLLDVNLSDPRVRAAISDEEWTNASRALRTATAAACFYLITTDILGPFGVGFALGTMGWGEGIGLYTVFGACAGM